MTQVPFETWLVGFGLRENPFAVTVADQERPHLSGKLFVHVQQFDRIRDESPILVFAPQGGGKSSLRIRLATQGLPYNHNASSLIVEYTDFSWLLDQLKINPDRSLTHKDTVRHLIMSACQALIDLFFGDEVLTDEAKLREMSNRLVAVPMYARAELATYFAYYTPKGLDERTVTRVLSLLSNQPIIPSAVQHALAERNMIGYVRTLSLLNHPIAACLADLVDNRYEDFAPSSQVIRRMTAFVQTLKAFGIEKIHFLLDRLDETPPLADDLNLQLVLITPLLSYLELLEHQQLNFKCFLSQALYEELRENSKIRNDRLLYRHAVRLQWTAEQLIQLLDNRLNFFSEGEVQNLKQICEEQDSQTLEKNILAYAQGSPRRLLRTVEAVFRAHYEPDYELNEPLSLQDWKSAWAELLVQMPPVLRISRLRGGVETAAGFQAFTKLENEIIDVLLNYAGQGGSCDRDALAREVPTWNGVCSPETMEKAINRLRRKMKDDMQPPIYLLTIRNRGYLLQNYEIVD